MKLSRIFHRGGLNEPSRPGRDHPAVRIAVMGAPGSGKTTFINLATGTNRRVGMGPESCTAEVKLTRELALDGRKITLIDIPGFDDTTKSDTQTLNIIAAYLADRYEERFALDGIIYIHCISENRFSRIAGRNFDMFRKICGECAFKNTIIITNMWKDGSQDINEARERELYTKFFKPALDLGARMIRHQNTVESTHNIIRRIMENNPAALRIQQELVVERKDIVKTMAGKLINREFNEQISQHRTELREVREEMERALWEKGEETRRELEEKARWLQERMAEITKDENGMSAGYLAEKARIKSGRGAQKTLRDEANHPGSLRDETDVADRARSKQRTKRPQNLTGTPTTIPFDEPARHDTAPRTRETVLPSLLQKQLPSLPPNTSSTDITSHVSLSSSWLYDSRSDISATLHSSLSVSERASASERRSAPVPPVGIAVMGAPGSGKTSFINLASGSNLRIGTNSTAEVQLSDEFVLDGRAVTLIDTPGFNDTVKGDTGILKTIATFLATAYEKGSKLTGIIYIHRISDDQSDGIAERNLDIFCKLCGDAALKNVILVTNTWSGVSPDASVAREFEFFNSFFKMAVFKGAQMIRHHNTVESAHDVVRRVMANRPVVLQIQRELVDERKDIVNTTVGEAISQEPDGQTRRHQAKRKKPQEWTEAMEQGVKKREWAEVEHKRQSADLNLRLQDATNPSAADPTRSEETKKPEDRVATAVAMPRSPPPRPPRRSTPSLPLSGRAGVSEHRSIPASPIRIAVMGANGSGKTTFINLASGSNLRIGMGLESCTAEVQLASKFTLDGRPVVLIDTPGFDDTSKSDTDILKMIAFFLADTYEEGTKLAGVIYVHRISDNRFGGITGRNFNMFRKLCGESTLKNVILVTNMWNVGPHHINESRESELSSNFFKPALDSGSQMVRHYNTLESARNIIRKIMGNHLAMLQIQRELVDERKDIGDTAAGETVDRELKELTRHHQTKLNKVQEEMARAMREKDEEMRRELEEIERDLREKSGNIEKGLKTMAANYKAEKERAEARMREMEEEAKQDRERAEAEYDQKLAALTSCLQLMADASAADRARWEQEIRRLRDRVTIPIYDACDEEDQTGSTRAYLSTDRVLNVRNELLKGARPRGIFARHRYVEVVLRGETKGKFLEDPKAHRDEMMGQVSRLVYWTHADIDRKVEEITLASHGFSKVAVGAVASLAGRTEYYQHLLSARNARGPLRNRSVGNARGELVW